MQKSTNWSAIKVEDKYISLIEQIYNNKNKKRGIANISKQSMVEWFIAFALEEYDKHMR